MIPLLGQQISGECFDSWTWCLLKSIQFSNRFQLLDTLKTAIAVAKELGNVSANLTIYGNFHLVINMHAMFVCENFVRNDRKKANENKNEKFVYWMLIDSIVPRWRQKRCRHRKRFRFWQSESEIVHFFQADKNIRWNCKTQTRTIGLEFIDGIYLFIGGNTNARVYSAQSSRHAGIPKKQKNISFCYSIAFIQFVRIKPRQKFRWKSKNKYVFVRFYF